VVRARRHPPAVLREQLVHQAPEQRIEREVPLYHTGESSSRRRLSESEWNRREQEGVTYTLKSSRSRERGSAVSVGMVGGNLASGGRRSICSGGDNDNDRATAAVGGLRSAGGGDGPG
jgi:hypothetical protein